MDIKQMDADYIANTYVRYDLVAVSGSGAGIKSAEGAELIDLSSGIGVNIFGVNDSEWKEAVIDQIEKLQHISNHFYTGPQAELARLLCEKTGMKKVFFGNSGAEANECAIKAARKYSSDKYGEGRSTIITLINSFHGRTMATLSATGQESMHTNFAPFLPGFIHVPANDIDGLAAALDESVCAIMLEIVQGEGGVLPLEQDYVKRAAELCAQKDVLLMLDEIQTGNGRTGSLYAYMQYDIMPDVVTTAKGLAGGLPMGACMLGEKLKDTLSAGAHGSTFGGNPVCAAGAVSVISRITDELMADVRAKSALIKKELEGAEGVKSVTGMGLMIGIEIEKEARAVVEQCLQKGVIVLTAKDKVRLLPPLNIPDNELLKALGILKEALSQ